MTFKLRPEGWEGASQVSRKERMIMTEGKVGVR